MKRPGAKSAQPRPQDDEKMARICHWLKDRGLFACTDRSGRVRIYDKATKRLVKKL